MPCFSVAAYVGTSRPISNCASELAVEINRQAEKNALILGHNYMSALYHSIPDFVGDSLELCRQAAAADGMSSFSAASSSWPRLPRS
jgi:quinolinate synthase